MSIKIEIAPGHLDRLKELDGPVLRRALREAGEAVARDALAMLPVQPVKEWAAYRLYYATLDYAESYTYLIPCEYVLEAQFNRSTDAYAYLTGSTLAKVIKPGEMLIVRKPGGGFPESIDLASASDLALATAGEVPEIVIGEELRRGLFQ